MVNPKLFFSIFLCLAFSTYTSQQQTEPSGFKVREKIGNHHPFHIFDEELGEERHSTVLHIEGTTPTGEQHNVWFLMLSIQKVKENINIENIKTNHTTKKLIYANGSLELVGKKAAYANQNPDSPLHVNEYTNTIIPRTIIWAGEHEKQYIQGFQIDRMAETNETQHFCSLLKQHYTGIIVIKTRRKHMDRCSTIEGHENLEIDCLPSSKYPMNIYCDVDSLPQCLSTQSSAAISVQSAGQINLMCPTCRTSQLQPNDISQKTNLFIFSRNTLLALGFFCLSSAFLIHHFFDISIQVALKK